MVWEVVSEFMWMRISICGGGLLTQEGNFWLLKIRGIHLVVVAFYVMTPYILAHCTDIFEEHTTPLFTI
jgi:hypothetical protein